MTTYILKTEPNDYSYDDLVRDKGTIWDGVKNPSALRHMRDAAKGDLAFIYHTGDEKAIVGMARITSTAYEDPENPGLNSRGEPARAVFDIKPKKKAPTRVTLKEVKADKRFADFALVRQPRLSVMPVPPKLEKILLEMTGL